MKEIYDTVGSRLGKYGLSENAVSAGDIRADLMYIVVECGEALKAYPGGIGYKRFVKDFTSMSIAQERFKAELADIEIFLTELWILAGCNLEERIDIVKTKLTLNAKRTDHV